MFIFLHQNHYEEKSKFTQIIYCILLEDST